MKPTKAGFWMDHSHAYLIEFTAKATEPKRIELRPNHEEKPNGTSGEIRMHEKEQRELTAYYQHLKDAMKSYKEVLLFGPGTAKKELNNILGKDHNFQNLIIKTEKTDKLTPRQMQTFVHKHFLKK